MGKITETLDKLISDEGLKTDLTIKFSEKQMFNIFLVVFIATLVSGLAGTAIKHYLFKIEN